MKLKKALGLDQLRTCVCVTIAGAILHGLFDLWPSILTEFAAPVNESIWEHMKIVFWFYVLLMALGCVLPAFLEVPETWMPLLLGATVLLVGLMVTFTIMPPDFLLFHDASLVDAWVVYPY